MQGSKRKPQRRRKRTLKQKTSFGAFIILIAFIALTKAADSLGIMSYEDMFTLLKLREPNTSDSHLSVHYIDVGQGDSILIKSGDSTVLIDAGESEYGDKVAAYLKQQNVQKIDYVIATHPHSDHIGGLPAVFEQFEVENVIAPKLPDDMVPTTVTYTRFLEAVQNEGCGLTAAGPGNWYTLDGSVLKILGPVSDDYTDLNNFSVVTQLTHGENSFLFMGDAEKESETDMINYFVPTAVEDERQDWLRQTDVLKAGHHGSNSSSSQKFLDIIKPKYAVIMCGVDNKYNHPGEQTMERLAKKTKNIYRTDSQGTIVIESDNNTYNVKTGVK